MKLRLYGIKFFWLLITSIVGAGLVITLYSYGVEHERILQKILTPLPLMFTTLIYLGVCKILDWSSNRDQLKDTPADK